MIAAYSASAYTSSARGAVAGLVVALGAAFMGEDLSDKIFIVIVLGAAWLLGFVIGQRSVALKKVEEHNRDLAMHLAEAAGRLAEAGFAACPGANPTSWPH